jgi:chromosomal replication initiator protein
MADPSIRDIREATQRYFEISGEDMLGRRRLGNVAHPRQLAMYIARQETGKSLKQIGMAFNRHHATVVHGVREAGDRVAQCWDWSLMHKAIVAGLGERRR